MNTRALLYLPIVSVRGLHEVSRRSAFLVDEGGTVRGAWDYATDEVPDFDELLRAARALRD